MRITCFSLGIAAVLTLLHVPSPAAAWGGTGHSVIAEIAQQNVPAVVRRRIGQLIGAQTSLASIASWADTRSALAPQTRRWHYVNIPVAAAGYDQERDCEAKPEGDCLVAALERAMKTLSNARAERALRAEALRYVVHLVADAHQPLHCAEKDGDAGGTQRRVQFFGPTLSLHQVWDFAILDRVSYDWGEHVRHVDRWVATQDKSALARGRPVDWINECHRLAGSTAYAVSEDGILTDAYLAAAVPVTHQQLGKAALRLARVLTEALSRPVR